MLACAFSALGTASTSIEPIPVGVSTAEMAAAQIKQYATSDTVSPDELIAHYNAFITLLPAYYSIEVEAEVINAKLTAMIAVSNSLLKESQHKKLAGDPHLQKVDQLISEGLLLSQKAQQTLLEADFLRVFWLRELFRDQLLSGTTALEKAIDLYRSIDAVNGKLIDAYRDLSYSYILMGRIAEAKSLLRKCIVYDTEAQDTQRLINDYFALADAYLKSGDTTIARRYFELVIELNTQRNTFYDNIALSKIGSINRSQGRWLDALKDHKLTHQYFATRHLYREIVSQIELAKDYLALGDLMSAADYAEQALNDARSLPEQRLDAALLLLNISVKRNNAAGVNRWRSETDQILSQAAKRSGNHLVYPLKQIEFSVQLLKYYSQINEVGRIREIGSHCIEIIREVGLALRPRHDDYLAWSAKIQPFIGTYAAALYHTRQGGILTLLDSFSALSSQISASIVLNTNGVESEEELRRLDNFLTSEQAVVTAYANASKLGNSQALDELKRRQQLRDISRELYISKTERRDTQVDNLPRFQTQVEDFAMPPGDLVVRFYVQEEVSFAIVKDNEDERYIALPSRQNVEALVSAAITDVNFMGTDGVSSRKQRFSKLGQLLPVELLNNKRYNRLIIITDEVVHQVPFSLIDIQPRDPAYHPLIDDYQVVRTYSAREFYESSSNAHSEETGSIVPEIAVFADPVFNANQNTPANSGDYRSWLQGLQQLPHTAREARFIQAAYPPGKVSVYLGPEATTAKLLSPELRGSDVLHIATHGYYSPSTPQITAIATSVVDSSGKRLSGFLSLSELLSRPFDAKLIVVSGCETMLGQNFQGQGVRSLTQGLMSQGADAVIGTLWKVSDKASAEFMRVFYNHLMESNGDVVSSLTQTKQFFIDSVRYSEPRYWAGYSLTARTLDAASNAFRRRGNSQHAVMSQQITE